MKTCAIQTIQQRNVSHAFRHNVLHLITTRFAPSPTGLLHLGHVYAAWFAREHGHQMRLRIEDIDLSRSRPEYARAIEDDLLWLGIPWDGEAMVQSRRFDVYQSYLDQLIAQGLVYRCVCTRQQIQAEIESSGDAPHSSSPVYPGTCRKLNIQTDDRPFAFRLNSTLAMERTGQLAWTDGERGLHSVDSRSFGDFVVARKDTPASYHLCVVIDDDAQGVTLVTRGVDLLEASAPQRLLQALLGLAQPTYLHHGLVVDGNGKRLAKRDDAKSVRTLREEGHSPKQVLQMALNAVALT